MFRPRRKLSFVLSLCVWLFLALTSGALQTRGTVRKRFEDQNAHRWLLSLTRNQAEVARVLVGKGANADLLNNAKCTALYIAVNKGFTEVVQALCEHNCDVNLPVGFCVCTLWWKTQDARSLHWGVVRAVIQGMGCSFVDTKL